MNSNNMFDENGRYIPHFVFCKCGVSYRSYKPSEAKCFDCVNPKVKCCGCNKLYNKKMLSFQNKCFDCEYPKIKCSVCSKTYRVQMQDGKCTTC